MIRFHKGMDRPRRFVAITLMAGLVAICLGTFGENGFALAQQAALPDPDTGWMNTPGVTPDEVNEVAREIWCPLCSGVRLDSCELRACDQMKDVIAIKLAEGEDNVAIKNYFLEQYGPQILGEPPREGFNWLAWILPVVAVTGGGFFLWRQAQRLVRPPQGESETAPPLASTSSFASAETPPDPETTARQAAERRLDEELARYG